MREDRTIKKLFHSYSGVFYFYLIGSLWNQFYFGLYPICNSADAYVLHRLCNCSCIFRCSSFQLLQQHHFRAARFVVYISARRTANWLKPGDREGQGIGPPLTQKLGTQ